MSGIVDALTDWFVADAGELIKANRPGILGASLVAAILLAAVLFRLLA
jgi:hypothetical protein